MTEPTVKIVFDELGQQVSTHETEGNRLTGLYRVIERQGWQREVGEVTAARLADANVLVLTNRVEAGYTGREIKDIVKFVRGGGGLWCLANHAAFKADSTARQLNNHVRFDSAITTTFLTDLQAAAYQSTNRSDMFVTLEGDNLKDHPILGGGPATWPSVTPGGDREVQQVVTRSFCGVYTDPRSTTLVGLDGLDEVKNLQTDKAVGRRVVWAVALDGENVTGEGRAVICADAGWLADVDSTTIGSGAFQKPSNPQFALNTLSWLAQLPLL